LTTSLIVNADVDAAAAIVDTKLATISTAGKVANSATTATASNTANAIVLRDSSGNTTIGTLTAATGVTVSTFGAGVVTSNSSGVLNSNATTNHAVQIGNAGNTLTSLTVGTNGQVLIGATGADPKFASLTSTGGTITYTTGVNTLNVDTSGIVPTSFTTDASAATPSGGALKIAGGTNISTSGSGSTVTVSTVTTPTFTSATFSGTTDQLLLGTTKTTKITSPAPAASRTYTIVDAGADANFMMTAGKKKSRGFSCDSCADKEPCF
jgi:trimeric autotransporter adhesin